MSAAGSDYLGSGASVTGAGDAVSNYVEQLVNPWTGTKLQRVPDNNLRPTALARFYANRTYTIPSTAGGSNFLFGMHTRLSQYINNYGGGLQPSDVDNVVTSTTIGAGTTPYATYAYGPGCILGQLQFPDVGGDVAGFTNVAAPPTNPPWSDDFGTEMTEATTWMAAYRCVSAAMRARIVGLPPGTFMTPGKMYFGQIRYNYDDVPSTEQDWTQLERLGYATHVSLDAVREAGSKTFFVVPDGADKFELTSNFYPAGGIFNTTEVAPGTLPQNIRLFPLPGTLTGRFARSIVPYQTSSTGAAGTQVADPVDQQVADQTMVLLSAVFGTQQGVVIEMDYAQIHEYVATPAAPPGIDTEIQLPSSSAMDGIFAATAVISQLRGSMVQAAGDKTILSNPAHAFAGPSGEASRDGRRTKSSIMEAVRRAMRSTVVPRRKESFWDFDWLTRGSLGAPGSGLSWDFGGKGPKGNK